MEFKEIQKGERSRTYMFPTGTVKISGATAIAVSERNGHRVQTEGGGKFYIPPTWVAIQFDMDEWSF